MTQRAADSEPDDVNRADSDASVEAPPSGPQVIDRSRLHARLQDRPLLRALHGQCRGMAGKRADDVFQETLARAAAAKSWPEEATPLGGWLRVIAVRAHADVLRKEGRTAKLEEPVEDIDAYPAVADELLFDVFELAMQMAKADPARFAQDHELFVAKTRGEDLGPVALAMGIKPESAERRYRRFVAHLKENWLVIAATMAFLAVLGVKGFLEIHDRSLAKPAPVPTVAPPSAPSPATKLRAEAFAACTAERWNDCWQLFESAQKLDPDGDSDPDVQQAREDVIRHLSEESKKRKQDPGKAPK